MVTLLSRASISRYCPDQAHKHHSFLNLNMFQMVRGTSLKILGLVSSDAGIYQCIATNQAGAIQAAAQLQVRSKGNFYK